MNPSSSKPSSSAADAPNATKTSSSAAPPNGNGNGASSGKSSSQKAASNGMAHPQTVQFRTKTTQPNARAVGSTLAYKHPSRSHYGQPDAKLKDPKFTNPTALTNTQRWELLESAKRWLPGEGTLITWKNHRYLIGPPIHMGMNGHIHYCYKYPVPKHLRADKGKDSAKSDGQDDEEMDADSPCVETLAAKIVPNTPAFAREIVILRALQECENVTELYDVLESERTLISILELAQADVYNFFVGRGSTRHGWNLEKPAVREHFSKMVISNVVQGLDQMHRAQYLHCDLKSLNILLYIYVTDHSNRRGGVYIKAKLTDFGHSSHGTTRIAEKLFSNGMARVGTAGHVAPELFKEGTKCTEKIDIWSLGIVMFSMLVPGRLLFSEYTNLDALKRGYDRLNKMNPWSRDRPSWWTDFERLSPEARDLILWMTRYDPQQRPTCEQILKHPWFLIGKQGHREHYRAKLKYVDMLCSSSIAQE
jgi:serine/threonine protein kinase